MDHLPITLSVRIILAAPNERRLRRLIRFEEMWTKEGKGEEVIKEAWSGGVMLMGVRLIQFGFYVNGALILVVILPKKCRVANII